MLVGGATLAPVCECVCVSGNNRWSGSPLSPGQCGASDRTFLNGQLIGTGSDWQAPRRYVIPPALIRSGPAVLTVRVQDLHGLGGFSGRPDDMRIGPADGSDARMDLSGAWVRQISQRPMQQQVGANQRPAHLANGMLAPFVPYAFQGVIWYQGESNVTRAAQYELLFPAMIRDWRTRWPCPRCLIEFARVAGQIAPRTLAGARGIRRSRCQF